MEPEDSLPHSQLPVTCPYPEPAETSPYPHIPLPADSSYYYSPPIYSWVSPAVSFPDCSPAYLSTQSTRTHTHHMLCCRITTLPFCIFNKF